MGHPVNMKGTPEVILFGEGCQTVNCRAMAETVGSAPETLRQWKKGQWPKVFRYFAIICRIRGLTDEQIGQVVRKFA